MLRITLSANGSLYCCSDGVRGRGAAVKYLSHNASFHSKEKIAPSNRGIKQLGKVIYDWRHYLAVIQRKPGALRNGAPFTEVPDIFRRLQDHMLRKEGGDREMVDILSLVLHHDESAVLRAVELALESGVPTKTHILNLLHRLIDPKQTDHPEIDPPDALALETAPKANVDRYDDLRQAGGKRNAS